LANVGPRLHKPTIQTDIINDYGIGNLGFIDSQWETGGFVDAATGTPWPDTDGDGLDDNWEMSEFGDLDETATGDTDGDGYLNVEEWAHSLVDDVEDTPIAVTGITWDDDNQSVEVGGFLDLSYTFSPVNATDQGFTLSSSDTGVVSDAGAIVGEGTATLTITTNDGSFTDDMSVTVTAASGNGQVIRARGGMLRVNGGFVRIKNN
jgi:uncharacterized protein YjdB